MPPEPKGILVVFCLLNSEVQVHLFSPRPGGRFYVKKTYNLFALLVKIVQYAPGLTLTEPKVILFFEKTQSTGCLDNVFLI